MQGERIGPYQVIRRLAQGGMAEIYLARQQAIEGLARTVVIKRVLPEFSVQPEFVTMFLDEARLMAALSHPNIVQTLDLGRADQSYFLVMEYVRGPTLSELLRQVSRRNLPRMPEKVALGIVLAIAEALSYVHRCKDASGKELNIVHRDLNPANVIVSYDGAVKLIDFGISKAASQVHQTRTDVVKGTYGYIAPEQFRREPVDQRTDVFGLGVLLYEVCLGRHPFESGSLFTVIRKVLQGKYRRPREIEPGMSRTLSELITRCLDVRPERRPQSAEAVVQAIAAYMEESRMVSTMGDIGQLVRSLVTDVEGPIRIPTEVAVASQRVPSIASTFSNRAHVEAAGKAHAAALPTSEPPTRLSTASSRQTKQGAAATPLQTRRSRTPSLYPGGAPSGAMSAHSSAPPPFRGARASSRSAARASKPPSSAMALLEAVGLPDNATSGGSSAAGHPARRPPASDPTASKHLTWLSVGWFGLLGLGRAAGHGLGRVGGEAWLVLCAAWQRLRATWRRKDDANAVEDEEATIPHHPPTQRPSDEEVARTLAARAWPRHVIIGSTAALVAATVVGLSVAMTRPQERAVTQQKPTVTHQAAASKASTAPASQRDTGASAPSGSESGVRLDVGSITTSRPEARVATIEEQLGGVEDHRVQLFSEPSGAMVRVAGRIVGKTPLTVHVPSDRSGIIVTLQRPGYETVERLLHKRDTEVRMMLQESEEAPGQR